ncbi:MAG: histidine--tRNA ligase, partial [Candidatus Acidiferrales bacterium]
MSRKRFQAVKGTRDILPPESSLWNRVEQTARRVLGAYNYQEIRLPLFEETEVFARSVGADTDIVAKEMYSFEDRDATSVSLRPEATASVVRAYIEHGMHTLPGLVKLYYIGPMFRRERPQKGRYRQFYQIGAEVLGPSDPSTSLGAGHPAIDAEVIEMVLVFIERCGLKGAELFVNSIGCGECRPKYVALLKNELEKVKSKLGPDSVRRIETNPLRVLDSKLEEEQPVIARLPSILEHLCAACRDHFEKVKQELNDRGIKFALNHRLVRGLDYYMRTTFEITAPGLGAQNAVCGGGRYDGLVELLGGPPTKGIGWALGTDRLVL